MLLLLLWVVEDRPVSRWSCEAYTSLSTSSSLFDLSDVNDVSRDFSAGWIISCVFYAMPKVERQKQSMKLITETAMVRWVICSDNFIRNLISEFPDNLWMISFSAACSSLNVFLLGRWWSRGALHRCPTTTLQAVFFKELFCLYLGKYICRSLTNSNYSLMNCNFRLSGLVLRKSYDY